jgi:hypothetical protein
MTPEMIGMLRQAQALIARTNDNNQQLETLIKAMFPPPPKNKPRLKTSKELLADLEKRLAKRNKVVDHA